jgi:N-acetylglucosamine-6-phosphate deacetylase
MKQCRQARLTGTNRVVTITWQGSAIESVTDSVTEDGTSAGGDLPWLAPGFFDLQVNGWAGTHFGDPTITTPRVRQVAEQLASHGVTHFLPTLITDSIDRMREALTRLAEAAEDSSIGGGIAGFHLEGPYLSSVDGPRGAHPIEYGKDPDWNEFETLQRAARGRIRMVTLAPERAGAVDFIRRAVSSGVRIAIGHTAAHREEILSAIEAGASLSTHLGNAAHDQIQRHHNYIFDQLGDDRLWASLIVDGHHLPPHLVKIFARAKGMDRLCLVSDAVQYTDLPPGIYDAGYRQFEVRADGFIGVVGEPRLAGSGLLLTRAIENFTRYLDLPSPAEAIACVTDRPWNWLLGRGEWPGIVPGAEASLVLYDWEEKSGRITVLETLRRGKTIYRGENGRAR